MGPEEITAIVLCGGSGARLGGIDKPMLRLGDARLIDHVVAAIAPQVGTIVISCGREAARYQALGLTTVADVRPGDGPLGGIASALPHVETDWVLTHPGDAPFPHPSLVERLAPTAEAGGIAVPRAGSHRQNLTLLMSRARADSLARFYERGGRAVKTWLDEQRVESVDLTEMADSFFNINTTADLETAARRLADRT